jgi:predicted metal-dependent peptidase
MILLKLDRLYGSLIVSTKITFTDKNGVTAYTNGVRIVLGKEFWKGLNDKERIFLLLHEGCHMLLKHIDRFKELNNADNSIWQKACDYYINLMLEEDNQGHYEFIEGGLLREEYSGLSTNEIYKVLKEEEPKESNDCSFGNDLVVDEETNSSAKKAMDNIIQDTIQNNIKQFTAGSNLLTELSNLIAVPKVNWKTALSRYMNIKFRANKTYSNPSRRSAYNRRIVLKGHDKDYKLGDLLVYIDVSGSCTEDDIRNMCTELYQITKRFKPNKIIFKTFNTEIVDTFIIRNVNDIPSNIDISGGTDIRCCIEDSYQYTNAVLTIIMSDFYSPDFSKGNTDLLLLVLNNDDYTNDNAKVIYYT